MESESFLKTLVRHSICLFFAFLLLGGAVVGYSVHVKPEVWNELSNPALKEVWIILLGFLVVVALSGGFASARTIRKIGREAFIKKVLIPLLVAIPAIAVLFLYLNPPPK
jgi:hypothetical protein